MQVLVISPHSFVDLITNSSSEVFVYSGDKSVKAVEEVIKELIKQHNAKCEEHERHPIPNFYDSPCTFNSAFGRIYVAKKSDRKNYEGYRVHFNDGDILIESETDNSIPWNIQEQIENVLGATRHHLG